MPIRSHNLNPNHNNGKHIGYVPFMSLTKGLLRDVTLAVSLAGLIAGKHYIADDVRLPPMR